MTAEEVIEHFGSVQEAATALHRSYQGVKKWRDSGFVPATTQYEIEVVTGGALKASPKTGKKK